MLLITKYEVPTTWPALDQALAVPHVIKGDSFLDLMGFSFERERQKTNG